ncbi:LysE family translocator [Candidatus Phaeomarinobacter ectocarpi]|uniref:LysE family translocator n=1 Tax=Candidatus Phaeomarinibacter ectocarpi TaxID=1458461 RepID=UPI0005C72D41|nr:LysE family transporter [Candidatus Phaeomarinobacter ectocarpi]
MPDWYLVLNGVLIGIVVAAPIGPVNLICIRRTLAYGRLNGFLSGLGAAVGDAVFAIVAAFGLTAAASMLVSVGDWLQAFGGIFLIALGIHTYLSKPADNDTVATNTSSKLAAAVLATFVLTITNPATMLGFVAIFGGVGGLVTTEPSLLTATLLVAAVFIGSALWWLGVTMTVGLLRHRMTDQTLILINRVSGVLIVSFGLFVIGRLIYNSQA